MLRAECIGRVSREPKIVKPEGKSEFLAVNIACLKILPSGKEFTSYVEVNIYGRDIATFEHIPVGTLVFASGDAGTSTYESKGKTYSNIKIIGRIEDIDIQATPKSASAPASAPSAPAPARQPARQPAYPDAPPARDGSDDDVPF